MSAGDIRRDALLLTVHCCHRVDRWVVSLEQEWEE